MTLDENIYIKTKSPVYKPKDKKPSIEELVNVDKVNKLVHEIEVADIPEDEKRFLIQGAQRHAVFNFKKVADYYAHSSPEVQRLMEKSALVIIDFNQAIEYGYVKLSDKIAKQFKKEHPDAS